MTLFPDEKHQGSDAMRCPVCGEEVENKAARCPHCGNALPQPRIRVCPRCGAKVSLHARDCFMCGAPLDGRSFSIPWPDLAVVLLIATLIGAWFLKPLRPSLQLAKATPQPSPTSTLTPTPTSTPYPTPFIQPLPTPTPTPAYIIHIVQPNEGLLAIAARYGTTVEAIVKANNLQSPDLIWEGEKLLIPVTPTPSTAVASTQPLTYTVQKGQSLIDIAVMFRVPVKALMEANRIPEPRALREGEVLIIPEITPTPAPSPLPIGGPEELPEYPEPVLLTPSDGAIYRGPEARIVLSWTSLYTLEEDEWFVVRVRYKDRNSEDWSGEESFWTQATSLLLPSRLAPPAEASPRLFRWDVTIVQKRVTPDGRTEILALSPISRPREFYWH